MQSDNKKMRKKNDDWVIWDTKYNFIRFVLISSVVLAMLRLFLKITVTDIIPHDIIILYFKELSGEALETLYTLVLLLTPFYIFIDKLRKIKYWQQNIIFLGISFISISVEKYIDYLVPMIDFGYVHTPILDQNNFVFSYIGDVFFYFIILVMFGYLDAILFEKKKLFKILLEKKVKFNEIETLKVKFELKYLQSQINPHFLFNTLNSLSTLIVKDSKAAQGLTLDMANLYHYVLGASKKETWLIKEEINLINIYLNIESVRFRNRLTYEINVTENSENIQIPSLLIQPLIENAVKYGIAPYIKGGSVSIDIIDAGKDLIITIKDQHSTDNNMSSNILTVGDKTGIENIKKRLSLVYGENASFDFKILEDGAIAKIKIESII